MSDKAAPKRPAKPRGRSFGKGNSAGTSKSSSPRQVLEPEILQELADTFGEPALINGESREEYCALASQVFHAAMPGNGIERIFVRDVVDLTWEIRRLRRVAAQIVRNTRKRAMGSVLQDLYDEGTGKVTPASSHAGERAAAAMAKSGKLGEEALASNLKHYGLTPDVVTAAAFMSRTPGLERLERMILSAERRRSDALRQLDWMRQAFGKRLRNAVQDVVDAEVIETIPAVTGASDKNTPQAA
jgi:hypothetical protein